MDGRIKPCRHQRVLRGHQAICSSTGNRQDSYKQEVHVERLGAKEDIVRITLNKPEQLNALSMNMIRQIADTLDDIYGPHPTAVEELSEGAQRKTGQSTGDIVDTSSAFADGIRRRPRLVILRGEGGKAFCAGGDVKAVAEGEFLGLGQAGTLRSDFFREEYMVDYRLAQIAKEEVLLSLWQGVVMGGGVGISIHGSFRVATESTLFAMPETAIGIFPDVGSAYVLSRLPAGLGQYLGLSGVRLKADDLLHCGLATHLVNGDRLTELEQALIEDEGRAPIDVLQKFTVEGFPERSSLAKNRSFIDEAFRNRSSVEDIVETLEGMAAAETGKSGASEWAALTLKSLRNMSPTALKATHRHIEWATDKTLRECFQQDFRLMQHMMSKPDFYEGVRALIIDKDKKPKWKPSALANVTAEDLEVLALGENELIL